jgi:predicted phage terminase large subunit-like protein
MSDAARALDFDPAWIDYLSPDEQEILVDSMNRLVGGESLVDYCKRLVPHQPPPRHVFPVLDVIEQARLRPVRVCIDMGPGHGKTTYLMRSIAWWLHATRSPGDLCAYITHSDEKAREKSRIAKELVELDGARLPKATEGHWLTERGGGLVAKGAKGGIMGVRIPGLLIYDDPYKDVAEARSPAINSLVIERFKAAAFTRLQGGSIIVMHTRWHEDDLIGWITKNHKWDHVHIPTIAEADDPLGRTPGEAAWPQKYPNADRCPGICAHDGHLVEIRRTLGEHLFAALYQGRPRPEGTSLFHEPARFSLRSGFSWTGKRGVIAIDPAATAKTSADFSVLLVCAMEGYGVNSRMYVVDRIRVQREIPDVVQLARDLQRKYRLMIVCESIGGFKAVAQSLRKLDPSLRVLELAPSKDKFTRALPVAAAWNDGRVLIPTDAEWADEYVSEHVRFTGSGDVHDDQVDTTGHAWTTLYRAAPKITEADYASSSV